MSLEYCTIAIVVLFNFWNTMLNRYVDHTDKSCLLNATGHRRQSEVDQTDDTKSATNKSIFRYIFHNQLFVLIGSIFMGLLIMTIQMTCTYDLDLDEHILRVLSVALTLILLTPMTGLFVWGLRALNTPVPSLYTLGINDYLLLLASAFNYIYDILRLIGVSNLLREENVDVLTIVLGVLMSVYFILQTTLQTKFLMSAMRNRTNTIRAKRFMTSLLLHSCIINACDWFITSLAHEWGAKSFMPVLGNLAGNSSHGHNSLAVMLLVVTPILNLYRFHSAVLAYELMKIRGT